MQAYVDNKSEIGSLESKSKNIIWVKIMSIRKSKQMRVFLINENMITVY